MSDEYYFKNNQSEPLTFWINPNKDTNYFVKAWEIGGERQDEKARISIEDAKYQYGIYLDLEGKPYLSVWIKDDKNELLKEIINKPILIDRPEPYDVF